MSNTDIDEPLLIRRARDAVRINPSYAVHGPELCPRDILQGYELGLAQRIGFCSVDERMVRAGKRLATLVADLEHGLSPDATIQMDWTTGQERRGLSEDEANALARSRFVDDVRMLLALAREGTKAAGASSDAEEPLPQLKFKGGRP